MADSYLPECLINFGKIHGSLRGLQVDVASIGALMVFCSDARVTLTSFRMNTDTGEIIGVLTGNDGDPVSFRMTAAELASTKPSEWDDLMMRSSTYREQST